MLRYLLAIILAGIIFNSCSKTDAPAELIVPPFVAPPLVISPDSVLLNPYGFSPISALVNFTYPLGGDCFIRVHGKHGPASDVVHVFKYTNLKRSIPVIGLYADFLNTVNIGIINNASDTLGQVSLTIRTGVLPGSLPTSIIKDSTLPEVEGNFYMVSNYSASNPRIPLMTDDYGDIRWCLDYSTHPELKKLDYNNGVKRLRNGNFYFGDVFSNSIYEVDYLGKILNTWDLNPSGFIFHHDIDEKPDGNFIVSVSREDSKSDAGILTTEDFIIEVNRLSKDINTVWDLKESLQETRTTLTDDARDWMHVNSVLYDSTDQTIIVSGRTQGVVKLTFDNQVKWILSPHKGWGFNKRGENLSNFLLKPEDVSGNLIGDVNVVDGSTNHPDFEWCWYQHSVVAMPNGDILLFDNGDLRNFDQNLPKYSRAVEFKIDPIKMTVKQVWQYGKERGLETFSRIVSSVEYIPESNRVLFCPGYSVSNSNGIGGKIVEIDYTSRKAVSQFSFSAANSWGFHRAKRIDPYASE